MDSPASVMVDNQCPVPILFCGFETGDKILTGKQLIHSDISDSPIKDAYVIRMKHGNFEGRYSWDQATVLAGVRGTSPYFDTVKGTIRIKSDGSST